MADWIEHTQSVILGLIVSFLLAKLFSIVFSSSDENLGTNPNQTLPEVSKKEVLIDSDDDWEGVETTELDAAFCAATEFAADRSVQKVSNSLRLKLYGLYKVATEGACRVTQPSAIKITARAKWNAWNKLGDMSQEEAMHKYLEIITELYPTWAADGSTSMRSGGGNNDTRLMGPDFSSSVHEEEFKLDAMHDYPREDHAPLHSAVDRDQTDVAELLSSRTADINPKDNEGQAPLLHAAVCELDDIDVKKNATTGIQDDDDQDDDDRDDDDGTEYPSDLSNSNWQSIQP